MPKARFFDTKDDAGMFVQSLGPEWLSAIHPSGDQWCVSHWKSQLTFLPDETMQITNLDTAHAVALEREAIAKYLEREAERVNDSGSYEEEVEMLNYLAQEIRDGAHNQTTDTDTRGTK